MTWVEVPIIAYDIIPHPGTDEFSKCVPCRFERRDVKAVVIVTTIFEDDSKFTRGLCAHHAKLLDPEVLEEKRA